MIKIKISDFDLKNEPHTKYFSENGKTIYEINKTVYIPVFEKMKLGLINNGEKYPNKIMEIIPNKICISNLEKTIITAVMIEKNRNYDENNCVYQILIRLESDGVISEKSLYLGELFDKEEINEMKKKFIN